VYRTVLFAGGPEPSICFQVAELLYRLGDLAGARERYFMTIELDEDYVEARANLGCVLCETGEWDLAISVFEGALRSHPHYSDVHYHMGKAYQVLGKNDRAQHHWRQFLEMAPGSPWADRVREELEQCSISHSSGAR
jgi:Tfp pilus assembly protein PilF